MSDEERVGFMILAAGHPFSSAQEQGMMPGSELITANCGHLAWLSPNGKSWVASGVYTVCLRCDMQADHPAILGGVEESYAVPGTMSAVERHHGIGAADQVRAIMRDAGIKEL